MRVEEAEQAGKIAKEYRALEMAADHLERALASGAIVHSIGAQDEAESERSVHLRFTAEESKAIFAVAAKGVAVRLAAIKAKMEKL